MKTVLALDFGGTKTAQALVGEDGVLIDWQTFPAVHDVAASVEQIATACGEAAAVGIVVPGIYDRATGRAWCPNLWGMDEVPLLDAVRQRVRLPVFIDSDRSGYVLGESWRGAARGVRHVVYVSIGTGIGVGILSDGLVVRGAEGIAGAAGWLALTPDWRDAYGRTGCWEAESAGPAVAARCGATDAQSVVLAARAGDAAALESLRRAARFTGMGIANLISVLNPEIVVLGGGLVAGAGDLIIDDITTEARRWAQPIAASRCRIVRTELGETAGLLGAARLALDGVAAQGS